MIVKATIGRWRFTFSMAPITKVVGLNSTLIDGNHMPMWDFDNVPIQKVREALREVQNRYNLPTIRIASSGRKDGWLALCLKRVDWKTEIAIIASTKYVDADYVKFGIYRGHFTIRITPKAFLRVKYHSKLFSPHREDVTLVHLRSFTQYETLEPNWKSQKLEIKLFKENS